MQRSSCLAVPLAFVLAVSAVADSGVRTPSNRANGPKPMVVREALPPPVSRQGGDTVLNATMVSLPVIDQTGTTAGYADDYDVVCPYSNSTSPDVVYRLEPDVAVAVDIDMLGSTYDTKIYVYDQNLAVVACNDDFYPNYVSKLENVALGGGATYFLVIDGYGGDFGDYVLNITEYDPCELSYIVGAQDEMEPPLQDGYVDDHNGGCNTPETTPFGSIHSSIFIGRSGWYHTLSGSHRDTDWFEITVPNSGFIEITGDAEYATYLFELGPQDCGSVGVIQNIIVGPCTEGTMIIPGAAGSTVWFWVGPTTFEAPDGFIGYEFYYLLFLNMGGTATETRSWSAVKSLFD